MTASLIRSRSLFARYLCFPSATDGGLRRRERHPPNAAAIRSLHATVRKSRNRGGSDHHRDALAPRRSDRTRKRRESWQPPTGAAERLRLHSDQ